MNLSLIAAILCMLLSTTLSEDTPLSAPSSLLDCTRHGVTLLARDDMVTFLAARRVEQEAALLARLVGHCETHSVAVCQAVAAMQQNMGEHPKSTSWWLEMGVEVGLCVTDVFHHLQFHAAYTAHDSRMYINLNGGPRAEFAHGDTRRERYRETYKDKDGKINYDVIAEYFKVLDTPPPVPPPEPSRWCDWVPHWLIRLESWNCRFY